MIRIFIAEDDIDDVEIFELALNEIHKDVELTTALNGKELFQKLRNATIVPNLIFLDINMPVMNGYECIKILRSEAAYKDIPVIVLSTSANPPDIDFMYNHGATCYITKPIKFSDYKRVLNSVIEHPDEFLKRCRNNFHVSDLTH